VPRRSLRPALAVLAGTALLVGATGTQQGAQADLRYGPPYEFHTELMGDGAGLDGNGVIPLKNQAMITRTEHGYLYRAGQQDGHLVVTRVPGGLRFADTGTARFRSLARACKPRRVRTGVAAVCTMPAGVTRSEPLLLEVWPRDGDDVTDGSRLPATIAMAVLADAGKDVTRTGAGDDFINSAQERDRASGGAGNDWIRGGAGNDALHGGAGADYMVGTDGRDRLVGGSGDDRLAGGDARDWLYAGSGRDIAQCGAGTDYAQVDALDKDRDCETVDRR
jgi:hypothetical protein